MRRQHPDQTELLKLMSVWTLDELVDSFLSAGGFWTQDALIVVNARLEGSDRLVVIEGNRRLAALKLMKDVLAGKGGPHWLTERLAQESIDENHEIFSEIPYLVAAAREDVSAYLGFRHVTGIKEWPPTEKAEFISNLIDDNNLDYKEVARRIGSRADVVRQHYIAYKILQQIEAMLDRDEWIEIESKFSVLLLAMRSAKVRDFLGIDMIRQPRGQHDPIPAAKKDDLRAFIEWVFGTKQKSAIVHDSRQIDRFAEILAEPRSVEYLRQSSSPQFEVAYTLTKAAADLVVDPLREAARSIHLALADIGGRADEPSVQEEAWPVIEGGVKLAHLTNGINLSRARELLVAS
ncbi:MAG: hypothetical protein JWP50_1526 [Phenylobacterium sp.]|nr:hypothetical protein [Phenylobacterium sp.]